MISDLDLQLISTYLIALFTGGWIWDFLFSIQEDYQVVAKFPLMLPSATFFFSRLTTFVFLILTVTIDLFDTYGSYGGGSLPGQDGYRLSIATGWFFVFAVTSNSLLFLFRIRAVFQDSPGVIIAFSIFWLLTWTTLAAPIGCIVWKFCGKSESLTMAPGVFMITFYDTAVYIAVTIRLTTLTRRKNFKGYAKTFFSGDGMGRISQQLFVSSRMYYLTTIFVNMFSTVTVILLFSGVGSGAVEGLVLSASAVPNIVLQNALACRVHRQLKLGIMREESLPSLGHQELESFV